MSAQRFLPVRIAGTGSVPAGPALTTAELARRVSPPRDPVDVERRTGITTRHWIPRGASAAALGAEALRRALAAADMPAEALARIIVVCSTGGDRITPAMANDVAAALELRGTCDAFDLNNTCMGFLSAFDVAARGIATGQGPVAIVAIEPLSRFLTVDSPRPYLVIGDGIAAAVLAPSDRGDGVLASWMRNDGIAFGNVRIDHPNVTGTPAMIQFTASNGHIQGEAIDAIRQATDAVLAEAGLTLDDVRWVLPHQPNGTLLDAIAAELDVGPERLMRIVHDTGSVGSASIAISLDRLMRSNAVAPGDRVLMVGVGGGLAWGALLFQVGDGPR